MRVPLSWLKDYVDIDAPVDELAHRLTMAGIEVGEVDSLGSWEECYVGQVTGVGPHPNADRLTLCTVDWGHEVTQVVCGAPNVAQAQKIAYAKVGAKLFNSHSGKVEELKAAKIRGVVSEGMICSQLELGMGDDHAGILVLPEEAPVGMDLGEYLGDQVLVLELTPNRSDCLSVLGVARETAALTDASVREPDIEYPEDGNSIESLASVDIADPDLCRRYTAALIHGVKVGPSPGWMQERLEKAGMRPVNNIVDITNYVMLEFNQPLHAFDFNTLKEGKVIVRRARPGETLTTLDGEERKLSTDMLLIADSQNGIGLAGVIGGENTEISETTDTVLLESACFDASNNRRTAQALQVSSEASQRFEKGLRPQLAPIALRRAVKLILEIAGGQAAKGIIDVFPDGNVRSLPTVTLRQSRIRQTLGVDMPADRVRNVLTSLGMTIVRDDATDGGDGSLTVEVPYWRTDLEIEEDLIEELARIVGYDDIPTDMLSTPIPHREPETVLDFKNRLKDLLTAFGMQEVINYPVCALEDLEAARATGAATPIKLANPMSSREQYMRTSLLPGLLTTLAANQPRESGPVAIFELGRVYLDQGRMLPNERETAAGLMAGPRWDIHWTGGEGALDFYDVKGLVEATLEKLGVSVSYEQSSDPSMHPAKSARLESNGIEIGVVGEIHPAVVESFDLQPRPVAAFNLDVEALINAASASGRSYRPFGRFPAATRDLALLVAEDVPADRVSALIQGHRLVSDVKLFDVYSEENIPAGKRSLAYHIQFQAMDRTLNSDEVNKAFDSLVTRLGRELNAELRE